MTSVPKIFCSLIIIFLVVASFSPVNALAGEKEFFNNIVGRWQGPGKIIAGKYKGTRFSCDLRGASIQGGIGMDIEGFCRIGLFAQPMFARIRKRGQHYSGRFINGKDEKSEHLDITGGRLTDSGFFVVLKHKKLRAAMSARLRKDNKMNFAILVKAHGQLVPVINMSLEKKN